MFSLGLDAGANMLIRQNLVPESSSDEWVVDLLACEALHNFIVNLELLLFELWNDLISQVLSDNINQDLEVLKLSFWL